MALDFLSFQLYAPDVLIDTIRFNNLLPRAARWYAEKIAELGCTSPNTEESEFAHFAYIAYLEAAKPKVGAAAGAASGTYTSKYKNEDEEVTISQLTSTAAIAAQTAAAKTFEEYLDDAFEHLYNAGCTKPSAFVALTI